MKGFRLSVRVGSVALNDEAPVDLTQPSYRDLDECAPLTLVFRASRNREQTFRDRGERNKEGGVDLEFGLKMGDALGEVPVFDFHPDDVLTLARLRLEEMAKAAAETKAAQP